MTRSRAPVSFVSAAACLELPAGPAGVGCAVRSMLAGIPELVLFSSALTQERFSSRLDGLADNAWPFTFGHVVGVQPEVSSELRCRL